MPRWWMVLGLALMVVACGSEEEEDGDESTAEAEPAEEAPPPLPEAAPLAAGEDHTCSVVPSGQVYCWGRNLDGEVGDGTGRNRRTPVPVLELSDAHQVAPGRYHTCALKQDGTVWCWGRNQEGQLGDGTTDGRLSPVQVSGLSDAVQIGAGREFTCALRRGGSVTCWGNGEYGRLGRGSTESSPTPVEVTGLTGITQIAVGGWHACARNEAGAIWCWGANDNGQIGVGGDARAHHSPQQIPSIDGTQQVAAGYANTCAVLADGHLSCWGDVYYGLVGNGQSGSDPDDVSTPTTVEGLERVAQVGIGVYQVCARLTEGGVRCWGHDGYGNLGLQERGDSARPGEVSGLTDATHIAVGAYHVCATRRTGAISCWGKSGDGQLGVHEVDDAYHAHDRIPTLDGITAEAPTVHTFAAEGQTQATPMITAGDGFACGVRSDGHVLCWGGSNSSGNLGNGSAAGSAEGGVEVLALSDAVEVRASQNAACARRANGQVACWGHLGHFNQSEEWVKSSRPIPLNGVDDARGLAMSASGPCILHEGGTVSCQAGNGAVEPVAELSGVAQIVAGGHTMCARLEDGGVRCWGSGSYGQLGHGADETSRTPVEPSGLSGITQLTSAFYNVCARRENGTVSCWGANRYGQVGNGQSGEGEHANRPVAVRGVRNALEVAAGRHHACVRFEDHSMQCWGANDWNQLGTGQEGDERREVEPRPVAVADPATSLGPIAQLECGWGYCCTLHTNGQIQCWGRSSILGAGTIGGLISAGSNRPRALTALSFGSSPPPSASPTPTEAAPEPAEPTPAEPVAAEPIAETPESEAPPTEAPPTETPPTRAQDHRTAVERAVRRASRSCYGRLAARGAVTVRISVGPDGRVTTSRVISNGTGNQETGRCISGALVGQRFSRPRRGAVTYDIVFNG